MSSRPTALPPRDDSTQKDHASSLALKASSSIMKRSSRGGGGGSSTGLKVKKSVSFATPLAIAQANSSMPNLSRPSTQCSSRSASDHLALSVLMGKRQGFDNHTSSLVIAGSNSSLTGPIFQEYQQLLRKATVNNNNSVPSNQIKLKTLPPKTEQKVKEKTEKKNDRIQKADKNERMDNHKTKENIVKINKDGYCEKCARSQKLSQREREGERGKKRFAPPNSRVSSQHLITSTSSQRSTQPVSRRTSSAKIKSRNHAHFPSYRSESLSSNSRATKDLEKQKKQPTKKLSKNSKKSLIEKQLSKSKLPKIHLSSAHNLSSKQPSYQADTFSTKLAKDLVLETKNKSFWPNHSKPSSKIRKSILPEYFGGGYPDLPSKSANFNYLQLGMRVNTETSRGFIRFMGTVSYDLDVWVGLEMESATGKHDGYWRGARYFQTDKNHGLMVRVSKVSYNGINGAWIVPPELQPAVTQFPEDSFSIYKLKCLVKSLQTLRPSQPDSQEFISKK